MRPKLKVVSGKSRLSTTLLVPIFARTNLHAFSCRTSMCAKLCKIAQKLVTNIQNFVAGERKNLSVRKFSSLWKNMIGSYKYERKFSIQKVQRKCMKICLHKSTKYKYYVLRKLKGLVRGRGNLPELILCISTKFQKGTKNRNGGDRRKFPLNLPLKERKFRLSCFFLLQCSPPSQLN